MEKRVTRSRSGSLPPKPDRFKPDSSFSSTSRLTATNGRRGRSSSPKKKGKAATAKGSKRSRSLDKKPPLTKAAKRQKLDKALPINWPSGIQGPVYSRPSTWELALKQKKKNNIKKVADKPEDLTWDGARYQYATTSELPQRTAPKAIVYASGDNDIIDVIHWARDNKAAVALRSGGHHYLGFSSTGGDNVQLDLSGRLYDKDATSTKKKTSKSGTYPYHTFQYNKKKNLLTIGAGLKLTPFNDGLMALNLTVPHGECMDVRVGGHCQTGGYSPLGRTHGLLLDHIQSIRIITADGIPKEISRDTQDPLEREIFYATLGGSPGNLGCITHCTVKPIKDSDYPKSRGLKASYIYKKDLFRALLQIQADWAMDDELSKYYTCSLAVISSEWKGNPDGPDRDNMPEQDWKEGAPFPAILLWCSYSGKKDDSYDPSIFQRFKDAVKKYDYKIAPVERLLAFLEQRFLKPDSMFWGYDDTKIMPLSKVVQSWKWEYPREFNLPFVKRNVMCPAQGTDISKNGWVEWTVDWIDRAVNTKGLKVGAQYIPFSNNEGGFRSFNDGKTSEAWRDSCMFAAHDLFYNTNTNPQAKSQAEMMQKEFDEKTFGNGKSSFFKEDRRLIWAPFGAKTALDDPQVRSCYYDSDDVYKRILKTKKKVDEDGTFSPNEFCVGYVDRKHA